MSKAKAVINFETRHGTVATDITEILCAKNFQFSIFFYEFIKIELFKGGS